MSVYDMNMYMCMYMYMYMYVYIYICLCICVYLVFTMVGDPKYGRCYFFHYGGKVVRAIGRPHAVAALAGNLVLARLPTKRY